VRNAADTMKKDQLNKEAEKRLLREKLFTLIGGVLVLAALGMLVLLVWQKGSQQVDTSDFDGRIVDRWAGYSESQTRGSQPYFRLSVAGDDGKQFTVKVDSSVYESAKVGMRIKRRAGQIVLIETGSNSPSK
jgi:hypothetical protein